MKIYKDKELTEELEQETDLGIVDAGETKKFIFYVVNDKPYVHLTDLEFSVEHEEVKIVEAPKELLPNAIGELIIEWSPSIDIEEGLKVTIKIKAIKLGLPT